MTGGDGIDTLAFSGAITMADTDFRRIDGIESIRLANGVTNLTLGAIAAHAIDALQVAIDGAAVTNAGVTIHGGGFAPALSVNLANDAANVTLEGGSGNDLLVGGSGNDFFQGGGGTDAIAGGGGNDTASYRSSALAVGVNLATGLGSGGDAVGDTLTGIENVLGSDQGDILTGNGGANALSGFAGADTLHGGGGDDVLDGGAGDDTLDGGAGNDRCPEGTATTTTSWTAASTVSARARRGLRHGVCHDRSAAGGERRAVGPARERPARLRQRTRQPDRRQRRRQPPRRRWWRRRNVGGAGNDVYFVDNSGDGVVENPNEGNDTVFSTAHFTAVGERGKSRPAGRRGPARLR